MTDSQPREPSAIRSALTDRLKQQAAMSGRELHHVRRQFVLRRFLTRVFADQPDDWILKGGTAMVLRIPNARPSKDLDLLRRGTVSVDDALRDLQRAADRVDIDPFIFTVVQTEDRDDLEGLRVTIRCDLGRTEFDKFPIDIVIGKGGFIGPIERYLTIERFTPPPEFATDSHVCVYPIADQIAAMYERHGRNLASTRYHDLVDLILLADHFPIEHNITVAAIDNQRRNRTNLTLPGQLISPDPRWHTHWPITARTSQLPAGLHSLDAALVTAGHCYTPLLRADPTNPRTPDLTWNSIAHTWDAATTCQPG